MFLEVKLDDCIIDDPGNKIMQIWQIQIWESWVCFEASESVSTLRTVLATFWESVRLSLAFYKQSNNLKLSSKRVLEETTEENMSTRLKRCSPPEKEFDDQEGLDELQSCVSWPKTGLENPLCFVSALPKEFSSVCGTETKHYQTLPNLHYFVPRMGGFQLHL